MRTQSTLSMIAALACMTSVQAREVIKPDAFGYTLNQNCTASIITVSDETLSFSTTDDGAVSVALAQPLPFYGRNIQSMRVSENGYLALSAKQNIDDGADFSNDCILPAAPDNAAADTGRIYAYHDDLVADGDASVNMAFFADCPRVPASGNNEACTVIDWQNMRLNDGNQRVSFQSVLYHDSGEIAVQFAGGDSSQGATATVGIQNLRGDSGVAASCNTAGKLISNTAMCFLPPAGMLPINEIADLIIDGDFELKSIY